MAVKRYGKVMPRAQKTLPELVGRGDERLRIIEKKVENANNLLYALLALNVAVFGFLVGALIKYFFG